MIPVSANFKTRRKSGVFGLDRTVDLMLPVTPIDGPTASSVFSADFPASAVTDGDRTSLNVGPATVLYPPPAGPENFIGRGMWKALAAVPQSVTIQTNGAKVGRVLIFTHPTEGGIKTFKLQTAAVLGGPYTDVATILRVDAWEKYNGRATVVIAAPLITVTPTNLNRSSIPSVIDVVLTGNLTPNFWRVLVTDAGPFATAAGDGLARCCEIELYRREDVTSILNQVEISHGTDVRQNTITARQLRSAFVNAGLLVSPADFRRSKTGQTSIDVMPEMIVRAGIDGELVTMGRISLDGAAFDHGHRTVSLDGRARNERPMFDRATATWRVPLPPFYPGLRLDEASALVFALANLPEGMTAVETDPQELLGFSPGDKARTELENVRKAAHDRGVFVDSDGVLRSLAGTVAAQVASARNSTTGGLPGSIQSLVMDACFFDPLKPHLLHFWFQPNAPLPLGSLATDSLWTWDTEKPFATGITELTRIFADNKDIPSIVARRPGTNDFWFLSGNATSPATNQYVHGWTIANGIATTIGVNHPRNRPALSATFIGNVLYWSEITGVSPGTGGENPVVTQQFAGAGALFKWDVTTPFVATLVGNENAKIRGMAAVGTDLYYALDDGTMVKFPTGGAFGARTNLGAIFTSFQGVNPAFAATFGVVTARQIIADGNNLWMAGVCQDGTNDFPNFYHVQGRLMIRWDVTTAFATRASIGNTVAPAGFNILNGKALFHTRAPWPGPRTLELWDGVDGSLSSAVAFTSELPLLSATINDLPCGRCVAVAPATWYGKTPLAIWEGFGNNASPLDDRYNSFPMLDWFLYQDTTVVQDSVPVNIIHALTENVSYELGGATAVVNAVRGVVTRYLQQGGQIVYSAKVASTGVTELTATSDPLSLVQTPVGGSYPITRPGARFPRMQLNSFHDVLGTVLTIDTMDFLMILPNIATDDPGLLSIVDANSPYATNPCVAKTLANRVLQEGQSALRWITVEMPIYPEVEIADLLSFNVTQRTNIVPFTLVGTFRVVHVTHTIGASGDAADSKTVLELVSV